MQMDVGRGMHAYCGCNRIWGEACTHPAVVTAPVLQRDMGSGLCTHLFELEHESVDHLSGYQQPSSLDVVVWYPATLDYASARHEPPSLNHRHWPLLWVIRVLHVVHLKALRDSEILIAIFPAIELESHFEWHQHIGKDAHCD